MRHLRGSGRGAAAPDLGKGRLLNCIELVLVVGLLAVPVGVNFSIMDKEKEKPTPPTYLEPPP